MFEVRFYGIKMLSAILSVPPFTVAFPALHIFNVAAKVRMRREQIQIEHSIIHLHHLLSGKIKSTLIQSAAIEVFILTINDFQNRFCKLF